MSAAAARLFAKKLVPGGERHTKAPVRAKPAPSRNKSSSTKSSREPMKSTYEQVEVKYSPPEPGVAEGCVAVYTGIPERRFVVPTGCLTRPELGSTLAKSMKEFGTRGTLRICCEPDVFDEALGQIEEAFCLKFVGGGASHYNTL